MTLSLLVYLLLFIILIVYLFIQWIFLYFKRLNVEYLDPNFSEIPGDKICKAYEYFKSKGAKFGGIFLFFKPTYIPVDLELIKQIMQTDFSHFMNRGIWKFQPPIFHNLINMEDEEWKIMRAKLTPAFSSGKIKMMFQVMLDKTAGLSDILREQADRNEPINFKEIISRFTTDVIGPCILGLECNSQNDFESEFRRFGKITFERIQKSFMSISLPAFVFKLMKFKIIPKDQEKFFVDAIRRSIEFRENNNIFRKDFMQLLLQLKHKGKVSDGDDDTTNYKDNSKEYLSVVDIAAQCLVFFIAGFETSATLITYAVMELSQNEHIQDTLRDEIREILAQNNGKMTYEAILKMEYLEKVLLETLRKKPLAQFFPRICNKDFQIPGTNVTIKKGQQIILPYRAIHYDPDYWPDPEKFDPERFSPENRTNRHRFAYLAFGEGPRMCIGARFGMIQSKIGLAYAIKDFKLTLNERTTSFDINYQGPLTAPKGELWFNIEKVK